MKKLAILLSVGFLFNSSLLRAQLDLLPNINGAPEDVNYLMGSYLQPLGETMAFSLTNGWYNTAKAKKTFRFEVGISSSVTLVPDAMRTYTVENSRLQTLELVNPNDNIAPTAFGDSDPGPSLQFSDPAIRSVASDVELPGGFGIGVAPMAALQAGIGLPMDFELTGRYLPATEIPLLEGSQISSWGIGVKNNILQYIPKAELLPFSVSAFVGYSRLTYTQAIGSTEGNEMRLDLEAFMTRILVSKKLLFITFYGGVGFNQLSSDIGILGTYTYQDPFDPLNPNREVTDPLSISSNGGSGLIANLGLRVKFLMLGYISADYTFGTFNAATTSLGISWDL